KSSFAKDMARRTVRSTIWLETVRAPCLHAMRPLPPCNGLSLFPALPGAAPRGAWASNFAVFRGRGAEVTICGVPMWAKARELLSNGPMDDRHLADRRFDHFFDVAPTEAPRTRLLPDLPEIEHQ